jgi:hypothetical protein
VMALSNQSDFLAFSVPGMSIYKFLSLSIPAYDKPKTLVPGRWL